MQPLNLPEGSVRALLAVIIVSTTCLMFATEKEVPQELLILLSASVSMYFTYRATK